MYFAQHGKNGLESWQQEINTSLLNEACHADIRISVSKWQQKDLLENHSIQTAYLPNGVDVALCDQGNPGRFRRKIGVTTLFILYVGRNDPIKNPADFVRLAQRLPGQKFVMIGHALTRKVLQKEWGVDVPGNLYVYGPASHAEVQDALAACSALVVTSKREGLPTLVLEAMAHQKPVVVPDEAGCMEAINQGEFGFIYRQNDIDHLVAVTEEALADRERCRWARQRILKEYDWRVVAPKLDAIYQRGTL